MNARGVCSAVPDVNKKRVSVIIPTFNRIDLVCEAIESVRRQTYLNREIIVVDDGSTDNTAVLLQSLPDIIYVRQENQGQAVARTTGLSYATGEYISTLDSDDIWLPDFLEKCIAAIEEVNADCVFANWISADNLGNYMPSYYEKYYHWWDFPRVRDTGWRLMEGQAVRDMYLDSCPSPSSSLVFRRNILRNGWTRGINIGDDWCLLLDIVLSQPRRIAFTMQRLWIKRVNGDNIYDQRDHYEVKEIMFIQDVHIMLERFRSQLTAHERGRLHGHLAFHSYGIIKWDMRKGKRRNAILNIGGCLKHCGYALFTSPLEAWKRAKLSRWHLRPVIHPPLHELQLENLPPLDEEVVSDPSKSPSSLNSELQNA